MCTGWQCRYEEFFEPPAILNIQYQRCADPQQEKYRNRVTLADLAKENPQNQQVISTSIVSFIKYKSDKHSQILIKQNVRFTVDATIDSIDTKRPWFFKKCFDCKLKISDRWPHAHCKQPSSDDQLLYR